jgi:ABC-type Na+ efflux pump permease subunit
MRLVFLRLADTPAADYAARHPGPAVPAVNNQLLQTLSPDFVDVEERAKKIASDAVQRATLYSTLLVAVLGFAGYIYMHYWDSYAKTDTRLTALEAGLSKLSTTVDVTKLNDRTDQLGDEVKRLQTATEALAHPAAPPPPPASPAVISPAAPPATQPPPPAIRAAAHPPAHKPVKK